MSFLYNLTDTWNNVSTTFNSFLMNVSNGSGGSAVGAAASRVVRLQNNSTDIFSVDISGNVIAAGSITSSGATAALGVTTITETTGSSALTLVGAVQTVSNPVINATQTWNASGAVFKGIVLNITNTSSAAGSSLLELQVGGTPEFGVTKTGLLYFANTSAGGSPTSPNIGGSAGSLVINNNGGAILIGGTIGSSNLGGNVHVPNLLLLGSTSTGGSGPTNLLCTAANVLQLGAADAATASPQIFRTQGIVAGTTNVAGANFTLLTSPSSGNALGGNFIVQVTPPGASGSAQNTGVNGLAIVPPQSASMQPSVVLSAASLSTTDTDGFLYIAQCKGAPSGTPTTQAGRIPMVYDATNNNFYFYNGGWKKTTTFS